MEDGRSEGPQLRVDRTKRGALCRKDSAVVNAVLANELTDLSEACRLALPIRFKDSKN
jgi:hypothetical protein